MVESVLTTIRSRTEEVGVCTDNPKKEKWEQSYERGVQAKVHPSAAILHASGKANSFPELQCYALLANADVLAPRTLDGCNGGGRAGGGGRFASVSERRGALKAAALAPCHRERTH